MLNKYMSVDGFISRIQDGIETIGRSARKEIRGESHKKIVNLALETILFLGVSIVLFCFAPLAMTSLNSYALKIILNIAGVCTGIKMAFSLNQTIQKIIDYIKAEKEMDEISRDWNAFRWG